MKTEKTPKIIEILHATNTTQKMKLAQIKDLAKKIGILDKLAGKIGGHDEITTSFIREYNKGNLEALALVEEIIKDEAAWDRSIRREMIAKNSPMALIDHAIAQMKADLDAWFEEAKADPFYKLSWGGTAMQKAACWKAYREIKHYMIGSGTEEAPAALDLERWNNILAHISKEAMRMASSPAASSSAMSNVAENCYMKALADIARTDYSDRYIGEISWVLKAAADLEKEEEEANK
jgi:hypothetical protein